MEFVDYLKSANEKLVTIVQIESTTALSNLKSIAAQDGVDVLFVGPLDLSVSLGFPGQADHPKFHDALTTVLEACTVTGKAAGILATPESAAEMLEKGFRFLAIGSDGKALATELSRYLRTIEQK